MYEEGTAGMAMAMDRDGDGDGAIESSGGGQDKEVLCEDGAVGMSMVMAMVWRMQTMCVKHPGDDSQRHGLKMVGHEPDDGDGD